MNCQKNFVSGEYELSLSLKFKFYSYEEHIFLHAMIEMKNKDLKCGFNIKWI